MFLLLADSIEDIFLFFPVSFLTAIKQQEVITNYKCFYANKFNSCSFMLFLTLHLSYFYEFQFDFQSFLQKIKRNYFEIFLKNIFINYFKLFPNFLCIVLPCFIRFSTLLKISDTSSLNHPCTLLYPFY